MNQHRGLRRGAPHRRSSAGGAGTLLLAWAARAAAEPPAVPAYVPPETASFGPSPALLLLRTVASLALVVGLILAVAWLARARGGFGPAAAGSRLKLVESLSLGPGRAVHLVAVGPRVLLLGSDGGALRTLAELDATEIGWDPERGSTDLGDSFLARLHSYGAHRAESAG